MANGQVQRPTAYACERRLRFHPAQPHLLFLFLSAWALGGDGVVTLSIYIPKREFVKAGELPPSDGTGRFEALPRDTAAALAG